VLQPAASLTCIGRIRKYTSFTLNWFSVTQRISYGIVAPSWHTKMYVNSAIR